MQSQSADAYEVFHMHLLYRLQLSLLSWIVFHKHTKLPVCHDWMSPMLDCRLMETSA